MKKFIGTIFTVFVLPLVAFAADITITGTGYVSLPADNATVVLSVVTESTRPVDALSTNNDATNRVFTSLEKFGVKKSEIKTSGLTLKPKYVYQKDEEPRVTGYTVTHTLTITVCKVADTGKILDILIKDGANNIDRVTFDTSEEKKTEALNVARKEAVKDAAEKMDLYCSALGVQKGELKSFKEYSNDNNYEPRYHAVQSSGARVASGEVKLQVLVTIVWDVK